MSPPPVPAAVLQAASENHQKARLLSLIGAAFVALSAGSNYAFSSFAPQLQESLHLTSTQINLIGLSGNMGVYLSGPLWGRWVDKNGPRLALALAACLVAVGYGGLSFYAPHGLSHDSSYTTLHDPPSTGSATVLSLLLFALATGVGNSGALAGSMNAQAKSWGGNRRGTATGIVLAGFGLSAALYSTLSSTFFVGSPSKYLRSIAIISACTFIAGTFVIRIYPPSHHHRHHHHHHQHTSSQQPSNLRAQGVSNAPSQALHSRVRTLSAAQSHSRSRSLTRPYIRRRTTSEMSALPWTGVSAASGDGSGSDSEEESGPALTNDIEAVGGYGSIGDGSRPLDGEPSSDLAAVDITGWKLFRDYDFWLLFSLMAIVSGAGLLLINNVGTITRTLYRSGLKHGKRSLADDDLAVPLAQEVVAALSGSFIPLKVGKKKQRHAAEVHHLQAQQVSAISIGNAVGRIAIGVLADFAVSSVGGQEEIRVWLLGPVCAMAVGSQAYAAFPGAVGTVASLLILSSSTGLMYGTLFGICPSLNLEYFGLNHFSANWGVLSLAPVVAGNTFNLIFGYVYDSHVRQSPGADECLQGEECYRSTFVITASCAVVACGLAATLVWRRGKLTLSS